MVKTNLWGPTKSLPIYNEIIVCFTNITDIFVRNLDRKG